MVIHVTNKKVKELDWTRQMIQEIAQSIKHEIHKQTTVLQDEQKYERTLDDKEELQQYKMIMREIPIGDIKLLRMMYCDNRLKWNEYLGSVSKSQTAAKG